MKLVLSDLSNLQNETSAIATLAANNAATAAALENTLSRDGTSPNEMNSNLDMNSYRILNLLDAVSGQEPLTLSQASVLSGGGTVSAFPSTSAAVAALLSDETGTGSLVFGTSPTFTTGITVPVISGGSAASSTLIFQSTSGTGTSDVIDFKTGSQSRRWRINTNGTFIGTPVTGTVNGFGFTITQSLSGSHTNNSWNLINITSDDVDNGDTTFSVGLNVNHLFGGSAMTGGREAFQALANLTATSSASNTNRNYVGAQLIGKATASDGGTNTGAGALGAIFGSSSFGDLQNTATNFLGVTASEFDIAIRTGASARFKMGIAISGHANDAVQGASVDTLIAMYNAANNVKFNDGILFSDLAGVNFFPVKSTGTLMRAEGSAVTVDKGIDLSAITITTAAFKSPGFLVSGAGVVSALSTAAIPAGGTTGSGYKFSSTANFGMFFGSGAPSLSAAKGSLYLRSDGSSTTTRAYINTDGSTTWTAITTAA